MNRSWYINFYHVLFPKIILCKEYFPMKLASLMLILITASLTFLGCATGDKEEAWIDYGDTFTIEESVPVSYAVAHLDSYAETTVVVTGIISGVCQSKGCWMTVTEGSSTIRVRFVDYAFFVPWESAGQEVKVEGTLKKQTVSEAVARHWAEESGDPEINIEDIQGEQEVIMMMASAVAIKGGTPITDAQQAAIEGIEDSPQNH
jgi:hypothetical protein